LHLILSQGPMCQRGAESGTKVTICSKTNFLPTPLIKVKASTMTSVCVHVIFLRGLYSNLFFYFALVST